MLRRCWPVLFLIGFVVLLLFHVPPLHRRPDPRARSSSPEANLVQDAALRPTEHEPTTVDGSSTPSASTTPAADEEVPQPRGKSAVLSGLLWALQHQNEDGSWGDEATTLGDQTMSNVGVTSLVLLALSGAGYSQLSRDEYDGIEVGPRVKKGLRWLLSQQREDGTFRSGADVIFDQALGTMALSELYGMTASMPLKDPTTLALDSLARLQRDDGSWGGKQSTLWAGLALVSGEWSEIPFPTETRNRMLEWFRSHPSPEQLELRVILKDHPEALESLAQSLPRPGEADFSTLCHEFAGLYRYDGSDGVLWKKWNEPVRQAVLSTQNSDGFWNGGTPSHRLVRTSMAVLTLETYYRAPSSAFTLRK